MSTTQDRLDALTAHRAISGGDSLAPARHHRGAPDVATGRNPTFWVAVGSGLGWTIGVVGYLAGQLPLWIGIMIASLGAYAGFTVLHDSVHRVAHRNRKINDAMGRPFAWLLWFNYPMFRTCHLRHHAHTNNEANDPDHWVSRGNAFTRPFFLVTTSTRYWVLCRRHGWLTGRQMLLQTAMYVAIWTAVAALVAAGRLDVVAIIFAPTVVAGLALYYGLDYLPHTPFDSTERFHDTRIQPGRIRHALLLGQNYHLIHHLWVSVPWYRYRRVFHELEPELRARGARID